MPVNGTEAARLSLRGTVGATMIAHGVKHARSLKGTMRLVLVDRVPEAGAPGGRKRRGRDRRGHCADRGRGDATRRRGCRGDDGRRCAVRPRPQRVLRHQRGLRVRARPRGGVGRARRAGPGCFSVDRGLGRFPRWAGIRGALITAGLGLGAAAAQLGAFWRDPGRSERPVRHLLSACTVRDGLGLPSSPSEPVARLHELAEVHSGVNAETVELPQQILGGEVAGRGPGEGTTAQATGGGVDRGDAVA